MKKRNLPKTFKPVSIGDGNRIQSDLPVIREQSLPESFKLWIDTGQMQPGSKLYKMGKCTIIVSPPYQDYGWMLSISHPNRYPTWDEVAEARYKLLPDDIYFALPLPSKSSYISIHDNCFQLHEHEKPKFIRSLK